MRINCYVPVTLRIVGRPSDDQLAAAGRAVVRAVTARLAEAERALADRYGVTAAGPVELREAYDPRRQTGDGYSVPSYQKDGDPVVVPVAGGGPGGPGGPLPPERPLHPDAMTFLESKLRQFYERLPLNERIALKRNGTLAIGAVTIDGDPRLVFTVNNNRISKAMRAVGDELAITPWVARGRASGRGAAGAPNDAEQLMEDAADANDAVIDGMVVSRRLCLDCSEWVVQRNPDGTVRARYSVREVLDPVVVPRPPRPPRPAAATPRPPEAPAGRRRGAGPATAEPAAPPADAAARPAPAGPPAEAAARAASAAPSADAAARPVPAAPPAEAAAPRVPAAPSVAAAARPASAAPSAEPAARPAPAGPPAVSEPVAPPAPVRPAPVRPAETTAAAEVARSAAAPPVEPPARLTVEGRGLAAGPIEAPPDSARGGVEGAAQMINSALFRHGEELQNEQAQEAFDKLYREQVARLLNEGLAVTIVEVWEVPASVNLANEITGVHDAGDTQTFRDMWVLSAAPYHPDKVDDKPQPAFNADYAPDSHRGAWYEYENRPGIRARTGFKLAYRRRTLLPRPPAMITTFRPVAMRHLGGDPAQAQRYGMGRIMQLERRPMMPDAYVGWSTVENRLFTLGPLVAVGLPDAWYLGDLAKPEYVIRSHMSYVDSQHTIILETAHGEDPDPQFHHEWRAEFYWVKQP
ncbi:hypothetical protein [Dactylosporangium sp. CA-092794]|uniref:hypothetical protein n=1 Tax=Dactylosporangium sp. CA-092794 TaxID=3239929 RepID=UPI003D8D3944